MRGAGGSDIADAAEVRNSDFDYARMDILDLSHEHTPTST